MSARKDPFTSLKDILTRLMGEADLPFNPADALIWKRWEDIVGSVIAEHARPVWIKGGKLKVKVSDPIWLQELGFMEEQIKEKINTHLGRKAVEKIEFRLGDP